jgi:hypothetical protein
MASLNAHAEWLRQWRLRASVSIKLLIGPCLGTQHETKGDDDASPVSRASPNAMDDIGASSLLLKSCNKGLRKRCCVASPMLRLSWISRRLRPGCICLRNDAAFVSVTVATVLLYCWVCFVAMMHSSSQRVQGTNLSQLPVSHRLQCFGTRAIKFYHYETPIFRSDTSCTV